MADEPKELEIVFSDQVLEAMTNDPEMAALIKDFSAAYRQADHAVKTGQHKSFEDAMEAITGHRPEPVFLDDDEEPA